MEYNYRPISRESVKEKIRVNNDIEYNHEETYNLKFL